MGRGAHQADTTLFSNAIVPTLREAVADLGWLLGRGYVDPSATKLVGDRYRLRQRQRTAVSRSAAGSDSLRLRAARERAPDALAHSRLAIDAFNVIIGVETALAGGVLLRGADGALRDLSSVHGSYRRVDVTETALDALCATVRQWGPEGVVWFVDRPVSNSGRLAGWIRERAPAGVQWTVELPHDADVAVIESGAVACSADARILEQAPGWANLVSATVAGHVPQAWIVELRSDVAGLVG
ncbi:MAG: DUF434 domain-containing protein [Nannocystales bacterium]